VISLVLIERPPNPTGLLLWCTIGFCGGIVLFFYGFRLLQRRRLILDTPLSKIRSASMGMIEVSGLAVGPYTMLSPITARPCYYYRTLVWEYKQNGKNKQWVRVASECTHLPFFVDDNTGRVMVDPRGADLDLHRDFKDEFYGSFFFSQHDAPPNVSGFLLRHGVVTSNKIKVEEYCIKPKNSLFILGTLSENPDLEVTPQPIHDIEPSDSISTGGFSLSINLSSFLRGSTEDDFSAASFSTPVAAGSVATQTRIKRPPTQVRPIPNMTPQKLAAALVKAGITNPAAWAVAGVTPATVATGVQVAVPSANADGFDPHPPVVLMKGANNKTFLISWRSQNEVARSLGWRCTLMIWGGAALALLSLYFFLGIKSLF
jgi:hypothetical protein